MSLAAQVIDYMGTLVVPQGPRAGERLELLDWQIRFIVDLLQDDVATAVLTLARGQGKTTLIAALAAAGIFGPMAKQGAEVVAVAASFDQARIIFHHAMSFLSPELESHPRRWKVVDGVSRAEIIDKETRTTLKVKSNNARTAHGIAPSLLLLDEPAQWHPNNARKLLAALETSMGKIGNEKMVALGTRPEGGDSWFAEWVAGGADLVHAYAADDEMDPMSDEAWQAANPSWRHMPHLVTAINRDREKARESPDALQSYKALRLNLGVGDVFTSILISADEWRMCETSVAAMTGPSIWGVDTGSSAAMSSVAAYWPLTGYAETVAFFPDDPDLLKRGFRDGVGDLYVQMYERGELMTTPGRTVNLARMFQYAYTRWGLPEAIAGDRFKQAEALDALDASGIPVTAFVPRGQGYKDGAEDVKRFRRFTADLRVRSLPSLLLTHALGGARVAIDLSGNAKLAKHGDGTERNSRHRDDAAAALIMAVAEGSRYLSWSGEMTVPAERGIADSVQAAAIVEASEALRPPNPTNSAGIGQSRRNGRGRQRSPMRAA